MIDFACKKLESIKDGINESDNILTIMVGGIARSVGGRETHHLWIHTSSDNGTDVGEYLTKRIEENEVNIDIIRSAMNVNRLKILATCLNGASESDIAEKIELRGGALHHHIRELMMHGLLKKVERGKYATTSAGMYMIVVATGMPRVEMTEEGEKELSYGPYPSQHQHI